MTIDCQTGTVVKGLASYSSYIMRDNDARQAGATLERMHADGGYAIRNLNARQTRAICERTHADGGYAIGDDAVFTSKNQSITFSFN